MDKLVFIAPYLSSFIKKDIEILSKRYNVVVNHYNWQSKYLVPLYLSHQLIYLPLIIYKARCIIVSFGGYHSLLPVLIGRLFSVPTYIILNGTDCASFPQINYGSLRKPLIRLFCKWSYSNVERLLPVSESLVNTENTYLYKEKTVRQGFRYHFPNIKTKYEVIYNGLDINDWTFSDSVDKNSRLILAVLSQGQYVLKGGDLIVEVADHFRDYTFTIAGIERPKSLASIPDNVQFLGSISQDELRGYYRKSIFHLQLSVFEGFGLALCEAMLCKCIPIGSNVNIIPEIIGDSGFILEKRDIQHLIEVLEQAIKNENKTQLGIRARDRIIQKFNIETRENALFNLIS